MRKLLLILIAYCVSSVASMAQDTTWVQTFTFDSISTRRATFQFPQELEEMRFEKVLMYYKLKCSPLTPWDQYNCGEWDYLTYTRVFDHTGVYDSVRVDSVRYLANYTAPSTYTYNPLGYPQVDTYARVENVRSGVTTTLVPLVMTANATSNYPFNSVAKGSRFQMLITANELQTAGISAGNLQSLSLNVAALTGVGDVINPVIAIKATSLTEITGFQNGGFQTVYDNTHAAGGSQAPLVIGTNELLFHQPFNWNGTDNLIIEFTFDCPISTANSIVFEAQSIVSNTAVGYPTKNGVLTFDGTQKALTALSDFDLGTAFTLSFWAKGTGSGGTNTSILEAYDTLNNRVLNIHFPWSDNSMYFDAGEGSGYDRINKTMTAQEMDNTWNHWTFVKNAVTGSMKIFKNGVLWHSGTAKVRPMGMIHRIVLGTNRTGQYNWKGKLDEFQLFSVALDDATIAANYAKKTDSNHPNWSDLLVYYDFDEDEFAHDLSPNDYLLMPSEYGMFDFSELPNAGIAQIMEFPLVGFGQSADAGTVATNTVNYSRTKEPQVVFEFTPENRHFAITDAYIALPSGSESTYDAGGNTVSSTPFTGSESIANSEITYYEEPFEIVKDVEIGRFITPYGINFDLGPNGFTWIYDITDYQDYFMGAVDLAAHNTQELIDLKFAFIEGIPPRDVHHREPIWQDWRSYLYKDMDDDTQLPATQVQLSDTSAMYKIKTRFTGHGHNGSTNCCEWDPKMHSISIDGVQRFEWDIWEETACGDSPNPGQGGTWPYAREGWCPGDLVKEYDHELTPYVTPGSVVEIDYDIEDVPANDPAQGDGNYIVAMDLISYSAPNFQHDAAIVDILNPNNYEYYRKWNPSCNTPRVIIQNTGEQALTSCIIRCWTTYGNWAEFNWTGNLAFLQKEVVEIPIDDIMFWSDYDGNKTFTAQIYAINGYPDLDEYGNNNLKSAKYNTPESIDGPFFIWFKSNNKPHENRYRLEDSEGNVLFERTSFTASTEYKDTFDLAPGCYSVIVEDTDSDGLGFWYSSQVEGETAGFMRLRKVGGSMIETFPNDFGNYHRFDFSVGFTVGVTEPELDHQLLIFPNPNNGEFTVEVSGEVGNKAELQILDLSGRLVYDGSMTSNEQFAQSQLNLSGLQNGQYIAVVKTGKAVYTQKFIKQ